MRATKKSANVATVRSGLFLEEKAASDVQSSPLTGGSVQNATYRNHEGHAEAIEIVFDPSQISYRQRYVMIAALAPVIDLVMLDPNNPRAVIFQLDRIETHLGALPRRNPAGRLSPVQQIAASIATGLRTADAAKIDQALIMDIENSLMKLSDAISAAYLTNNERSDAVWEALA